MEPNTPTDPPKRKRGRPLGSRNRTVYEKLADQRREMGDTRHVPPSTESLADYRHADPDSIVSRQLSMLDWAQQAMRNEMQRAMQSKGEYISHEDVAKLEKLSNAIVRAIDALKKSSDLAGELASRLTPEQLLEAALKKIEGQDLATLNYAIRRLRAHRERLAPVSGGAHRQLGDKPVNAVEAINSLTED